MIFLRFFFWNNGIASKCPAEIDLDERVQVKALIAEVTLQSKNLNEITDVGEYVKALRKCVVRNCGT